MHTEGEEQFIASTVGQVSLQSCMMCPISQGAPSAVGQRCVLTAVEPAASASSRQWGPGSLSSPAPPALVPGRIKRRWSSNPSTESSQSLPTGKEANGSLLFNR